ncbi:MAG: peptidylprolyl isomerase [Deinococcus sp.]|uniref:peptidylprolyl isomerase n=1 Tax=Deinococcus sp. TaxID=47478 RepID=UPI0026DD7BA0|nr:peptidylprolyl isomerase [Deinococcus sp.]MDO4245137.1 peptidylprolyl isomerase [Deinococcus sp.]
MKTPTVALLLGGLLVLSACQNKTETTTETKTETTTTETQTDTAVTTPGPIPAGYTEVAPLTEKPVREFKAEPAMSLQEGQDYYALMDTSKGQILLDLYEQETPVTVNNFVTLARNRFYDGTRFHRVIDGFMAQGGDPQSTDPAKKDAWGTGGPGYQFADEFRSKLTFDGSGILAMANSGPATNGSQFFITFDQTSHLNGMHTIFGKVVTGDDVLPKLTRTSGADGAPVEGAEADQILRVRILTKSK